MTTILKSNWQEQLSNSSLKVNELLKKLNITYNFKDCSQLKFPLRVTESFIRRMKKGDIHDPLLKQILPINEELREVAGFGVDPVGDLGANKQPGLLHKYHGRVLLTVTGACAVNCRYCFRREFPYAENNPGTRGWKKACDYIANDSSIEEVIYSGGDPLVLSDKALANLTQQIAQIPHLKRLRIHTRLPVVLPDRITDELLSALNSRLQTIVVIHANHANEIDEEVGAALNKLHLAGIILLNQSVLLKDVNDNVDALVGLSQALMKYQVLPYYLHMLDKVKGAAHFEVDKGRAKQLLKQVSERLPGYMVPKLAQEIAGEKAKQVL